MINHHLHAEHVIAPGRLAGLPSFVTSLPDAVACYDAAGVCQEVFIPAGFESLLRAVDLVGRPLEADPSLPADAKPKVRRCLQQTLETGEPQACRYDVYRNGCLYARDVRFSRLDGDLAGHVLAVFRDITEMRQTELALEAQNRHLHTLVDALPNGIVQLSAEGVYLDVRMPRSFTPYLASDPQNIIGKSLEQVAPPDVAATMRYYLNETLQTGQLQSFEYSLDMPSGTVYRKTYFSKLNAHAVLGVVHDITHERHTEQQLVRREQQLQSILDTLPYDIARYDRRGVCLEHIPGRHFHNFSPSASTGLVGKHLREITHPSTHDTVLRCFDMVLTTGQAQVFEYQLEGDDNPVYHEATLLMLGADEVLSIIRDISDERQHQLAFESSHHRLQTLLDAIPDSLAVFNRQGVYLESKMPRYFRAITLTPVRNVTNLTLEDVLPAEAAATVRKTLEQAFNQDGVHVCHFSMSEHNITYYREARFVRLSQHEALGVLRDVTEQTRDKLALQNSERHLRTLVHALPDSFARLNRAGMYLEVFFPDSFPRALHDGQFVGKTLEDVYPADTAATMRHYLEQTFVTGELQAFSYHTPFDNTDRYHEVRLMRLNDDEVFGVLRDVTDQIRDQQALIASQQRIEAILSAMPDMIARSDREGTLIEIIHEGTFPRSRSGASIVGKTLDAVTSPERAADVRQKLARALDTNSLQIAERKYVIDGEDHYREVRYVPLEDGTCLVLFRDTTQEKRDQLALAASEKQLRTIFSVLPDVIAYFDQDGVHRGNIHTGHLPAALPLVTMQAMTMQEKPFAAWLSAADAERVQVCLDNAFASRCEQLSHYTLNVDGETYCREIRFIYFDENICLGLIRDISEAYSAKQALQAALEHSQALLKEVHHRVRNNLQMLSSLLQLHASTLEDDTTKAALADNRRRIQTLALVHRVLYDNESYADIALADFLRAALKLFAADMKRLGVTLELHADPVATNLDAAIPFGLIVNELVKNALEHAFSNDYIANIRITKGSGANNHDANGDAVTPRLQVYLQQHQQQVTLRVIDNGAGLSSSAGLSDTQPHSQARLGMMIIDLLTDQLRGNINITAISKDGVLHGTQAVLEFQLS